MSTARLAVGKAAMFADARRQILKIRQRLPLTAEILFFHHPIAANTTVGDVSWLRSNSNNIQTQTIAGHAVLKRRAKHRRAVSSETRNPSLHRQVAVERTSRRPRSMALRLAARPGLAHRSHHRRQHVRTLALGLWPQLLLRHLFRHCRLPRHPSGPRLHPSLPDDSGRRGRSHRLLHPTQLGGRRVDSLPSRRHHHSPGPGRCGSALLAVEEIPGDRPDKGPKSPLQTQTTQAPEELARHRLLVCRGGGS